MSEPFVKLTYENIRKFGKRYELPLQLLLYGALTEFENAPTAERVSKGGHGEISVGLCKAGVDYFATSFGVDSRKISYALNDLRKHGVCVCLSLKYDGSSRPHKTWCTIDTVIAMVKFNLITGDNLDKAKKAIAIFESWKKCGE